MILYTTETATIYSVCPQDSKPLSNLQKENLKNLRRDEELNGYLSKKTARTVTRRIGNLLEIAAAGKRLVTFVTLTLPSKQAHSDEFIKRHLLGDFLRIIKEDYSVVNYIWKAESQNNENIHFHLLCDNYLSNVIEKGFFEVGEINKIWNKILNRYGYIEPYRLKMLARYNAGQIEPEKIPALLFNKFSQPPSTEVRKLKAQKKPEAYINKYIGKAEPGKRIISGKIVGCSDSLRYVSSFKTDTERQEEHFALATMARENPKEVTRIAIVIEEEKKEVLPAVDTVELFINPSLQEKQWHNNKLPPEPETETNTNKTKKEKYKQNTVIKKNFTEKISDTILCIKYYYTAKLWRQYSPPSHKAARTKYFEDIAMLHYFGVLIE